MVFIFYCIYLAIMSLFSFFLFSKDKKLAKNGLERIKEKTLLLSSCFGGAIGSFLGRIIFRHKTDKIYFSIVIIYSLILQIIVLVILGGVVCL